MTLLRLRLVLLCLLLTSAVVTLCSRQGCCECGPVWGRSIVRADCVPGCECRHYVAEKCYCQSLSRLLQVYPEDGKPEKALQVLRSLCQEDGLELATSSEQSEK